MFVTGVVLAAGASQRLGQPKQLLAYRGTTLLDATLSMARSCEFDQLVVTLGSASASVRDSVLLDDIDVVENLHHTTGCASSIAAAIEALDPRADGVVLLLGDQPGIRVETVRGLLSLADHPTAPPLAVCRYDDGRGHPFWIHGSVFDELRRLHGDKGVWKLLESGLHPVADLHVAGPVPLDVDTWDDYEMLVAADGDGTEATA